MKDLEALLLMFVQGLEARAFVRQYQLDAAPCVVTLHLPDATVTHGEIGQAFFPPYQTGNNQKLKTVKIALAFLPTYHTGFCKIFATHKRKELKCPGVFD